VLRVFLEPERPGDENMRRDTELVEQQTAGTPITLRLYSWRRPTVSVGYMQKPAEILDLDACRAAGVDVVRRPTGGRAILHAEEITYALVASTGEPRFGTRLGAAHAVIGECLAAGLAELGVAAVLSGGGRDPGGALGRQPCFASTARAEIVVDGRKLVGSAQRRRAHAFLQHGSLLVGPAHERLADFLAATRGDPRLATAMRERLRRRTTTLRALLGRDPAFTELGRALVNGFCTRLGLTPIDATVHAAG
jgi:lipoate-protein ligase A